jgi:serine/threonine-protein kinase
LLAPGDAIDRYVIVRLLGSGGMGQVYEARDPRLQRSVALKVLRVERAVKGAGGTDAAARLLREARLAAALAHPNVVAIHDVGEVHSPDALAGTTYIAMELVAGQSLRAYVGDASVPLLERVRWLRDVAVALGAAHARDMVHRDIKPENVMVREDGVIEVLDFGIAKRSATAIDPTLSAEGPMPATTAEGMTVGTPYYMAPEQMRGEPLDGRADQFAWGVLAYELLAGELPWTVGTDPLQVVAQVLSRDAPLLTVKNPDVPTSVAVAVMRALAKDREHRFPTMAALLEAMDGHQATVTFGAVRGAAPVSPSAPTERAVASGPRPFFVESGALATSRPSAAVSGDEDVAPRRSRSLTLGIPLIVVLALGAAVAVVVSRGTPTVRSAPAASLVASPPSVLPSAVLVVPPPQPEPTANPSGNAPSPSGSTATPPPPARPTHRGGPSVPPAPSPSPPPPPPATTQTPYEHM